MNIQACRWQTHGEELGHYELITYVNTSEFFLRKINGRKNCSLHFIAW